MEMGLGLVVDIHFSLTKLEQKVQTMALAHLQLFKYKSQALSTKIVLANNLSCSTSHVCSKDQKVLSMPIYEPKLHKIFLSSKTYHSSFFTINLLKAFIKFFLDLKQVLLDYFHKMQSIFIQTLIPIIFFSNNKFFLLQRRYNLCSNWHFIFQQDIILPLSNTLNLFPNQTNILPLLFQHIVNAQNLVLFLSL